MKKSYSQYDDTRHLSDEELVDKCRNPGNNFLVGIMFKRYSHLMNAVWHYYLSGSDGASDAVMEIFAKLFELIKRHHVSGIKLNYS